MPLTMVAADLPCFGLTLSPVCQVSDAGPASDLDLARHCIALHRAQGLEARKRFELDVMIVDSRVGHALSHDHQQHSGPRLAPTSLPLPCRGKPSASIRIRQPYFVV